MKLLISLMFLFSVGCAKAQVKKNHFRYFLIGYVADSKAGHLFDGGYDTATTKYPNLYEMVYFLSIKYELTNVRIISICEMTEAEHKRFWKPYKKVKIIND